MPKSTIADEISAKGRLRLLTHGALIAIIGLISGFGFLFSILESITVWPITLEIGSTILGSERGWRVAHVAGVMNGLMMIVVGLALMHAKVSLRAQPWVVWGMVYTGWGNTIFFHCANLSSNRALSAGATKYGEADLFGIVGYLIGASTIPFTIAALAIISWSAWRQHRSVSSQAF